MREFIDDENIPAFLGGLQHGTNNDHECRMELAPGGGVPHAAIERFHELATHRRNSVTHEFPHAFGSKREDQSKAASWLQCCCSR